MAQSIVGTILATNWAASTQILARKVEICWDGTNWVDETAYTLSWNTRVGITSNGVNGLPMFGGGTPASGTLTLSNDTGRFSQRLSTGALYANIRYGLERIRVRISAGYSAELIVIFTGFIYAPQETEIAGGGRTVTLELRGNEAEIMQNKLSTKLNKNFTIDSAIAAILTHSGVTNKSLDACLIPIPYQWLDDENVWEECLRLAQAEMCLFWVSELGVYTLRRLSTLVERADCTTSVLTLNRGNAFRLDAQRAAMNAYQQVVVEVASRDEGAAEVIYTSPETIEVPGAGNKTIQCQYSYPIWKSITPVKNTDWYAVTAGVQDISGDITVSSPGTNCQRTSIKITNANAQSAYIYAFQIRGYPLIGTEAHDVTAKADNTTLQNYWKAPRDDDFMVADVHMKVGAYTIANARPSAPRGGTVQDAGFFALTVTVTADGNADTMGTLTVVGTSAELSTVTETMTPIANATVASTTDWYSITSITGVGWIINGNNDHIKCGYRLAAMEKEIRISGNPYVQTDQQAQLIATMACQWMKIPRTLIQWTGPGAPWLQPTDRVTVTDANSGINESGWVLDIQNKADGTSYQQTLLILPCLDLFPNTTYFIVGTDSYKDSGSGKAFY